MSSLTTTEKRYEELLEKPKKTRKDKSKNKET